MCKGQQRCPNCGGVHRYEECGDRVQDKCCNCEGQHRVTIGPYEGRKEVKWVKTTNNISYVEAVKRVQGQEGKICVQQNSTSPSGQIENTESKITVEKIIVDDPWQTQPHSSLVILVFAVAVLYNTPHL